MKLLCRKNLFSKKRKDHKKKPNIENQGPDEDYGDVQELINKEEWLRRKDNFLANIIKTKEQIFELMQQTTDQRESLPWHQERRKRITASVFEKICKLRSTTDPRKTAKQMRKKFFFCQYQIWHRP